MRRFFCSIFLIGIMIGRTTAQRPLFTHFKWFKVEDGLPQGFVCGLQQDKDGFLWIGTRDGLARYDGREFKIFRRQYNDSNSLASNIIQSIYLDPQNYLWIFYEDALFDKFDPQTFRVTHATSLTELKTIISHPPFDVFKVTSNGKIWFNQRWRGINYFDPATDKLIEYNTKNRNLHSDSVMGIKEDKSGRLWVITDIGIERLNAASNSFHLIPYPAELNFKFNSHWLSRGGTDLLTDNRIVIQQKDKFIFFDLQKENFTTVVPPPLINNAGISNLYANQNGGFLFESYGNVYSYNTDGSFTFLWHYPSPNPYSTSPVSFLIDRSNVLWYGTNAAGLCKVNLKAMPFTSFALLKVLTNDSLPQIKNKQADSFLLTWSRHNWILNTRFCYGPEGTLYISNHIGSSASIYRWKDNQLSFVPLQLNKFSSINAICCTKQGRLYAMDPKGNLLKWDDPKQPPVITAMNRDGSMNNVNDLETDSHDFWVATVRNGMFRITNEKEIRHFEKGNKKNDLPSNQLTDIFPDPVDTNYLWIGTRGAGLIWWHKEKGVQKIFTTDDGLPNNTIYNIVADALNRLWLSTNNGICCLDIKKQVAYNFDVHDGLPFNEFDSYRYFQFPDGRIVFGSDQMVFWDPLQFSPDTSAINVKLGRFIVNNKPIEFLTDPKILATGLNATDHISLPYYKNSLGFEFMGMEFNQPEKIRYRYMLKGYDKDWIDNSTNNSINYTRLPPGHYTLLLNASGARGRWSPLITQLSIRIRPPFWATWWAYILYGLITVLLIRAYWRYRENKIRLKNEIALEHNKAMHLQEVDEIKNRFFSNITHEFRTPLTLILTPLEKLSKEGTLSPVHQQTILNTHKNAGQLLLLINQLLDIAKIESDQMKVNLSAGDLCEFLERYVHHFTEHAAEKNISLHFSRSDVKGNCLFDEEKWGKIISNLLSNAIKFTPSGGKVEVTLKKNEQDSLAILTVSDNGIGISEGKLSKIFDRFYMVDDSKTRTHSGTGIGLSLVKELTELMKGTIEVKSTEGKGTTFFVNIPVQKTTIVAEKVSSEGIAVLPDTGKSFVQEEIATGSLIMIAEDNDELRAFLVQSLSPKWKVLEAANGKEAWETILKELPEIVISDVMMPEMDGIKLCSLSKNDARTAHISFIMLTAKAAHQSRMSGMEAGADEYITKPFHFDELELRIQNLLKQQENWRKHLHQIVLPEKPVAQLPHVNDIFLKTLYEELDKRLDEPGLDVETLAQTMTMSRRTLNRKLKALLNISTNDLIRQYRLQKAAMLLASGHAIADTAYTVGFETPSYFTQCFKEQYGQTPTEFAAHSTISNR